ncbi:UNKNOWN [Stylonychia lemnae]|uniref:Ibr domain containing protein n=1 Tax=Stylonychia lemnae TaxID=5949 RepID=A0A077ZTL0_STYLE|nr:UNKNOWN [Stylonychia lemnae]|eukprot:CDW71796.1 UNKNOWN [Stylonychia lemnae]
MKTITAHYDNRAKRHEFVGMSESSCYLCKGRRSQHKCNVSTNDSVGYQGEQTIRQILSEQNYYIETSSVISLNHSIEDISTQIAESKKSKLLKERNLERQYLSYLENNKIRFCPLCKFKTQIQDDALANKICAYCNYSYCYQCMQVWSTEHDWCLNPFKCQGEKNQFESSCIQNFQRTILIVGKILLLILLYPFFMFLFVPLTLSVMLGEVCHKKEKTSYQSNIDDSKNNNSETKKCDILIQWLGFLLGLLANIIAFPLLLLFGIPILIYLYLSGKQQILMKCKDRLKYRLSKNENDLYLTI